MSFGIDATEEGDYVILTGFRTIDLKRFIKKQYGASTFLDKMCKKVWSSSIVFHKFFLPEMVYLLTEAVNNNYMSKYRTNKLLEVIYENTWFKDTTTEFNTIVDVEYALSNIDKAFVPTSMQMEFVRDVYYQRKSKYHLNGYLLSFDMGLGKTFTSLMLGEGLKKKHIIVLTTLSTISSVWVPEVEKVFTKHPKKIWNPSMDPSLISTDTDVVIANYEAMVKVLPIVLKKFKGEETLVVIDEAHNFKDINSQRTTTLIPFLRAFKCPDVLPMTGTPVKALGVEVLPLLAMLDPWYNKYVEDRLKSMNRHTKIINSLFRNRLGYMMYRRTKVEIEGMPTKHEIELKIQIPNGDTYTLENVKKLVAEYTVERREYYKQTYKEFQATYEECLRIFEKTLKTNLEINEFKTYLKDVALIQKKGHGWDMIEQIKATNIYEKNVIIPALQPNLRASFRSAKSVIKYVELKILGEVLGGLLNQLRTEMCSDMMGKEIIDVILAADKKTILFSSYRAALDIADRVCKQYGLKTIMITGDNSSEAKKYVDEFKKSPDINPLLASIKAMSVGHTIIEANTAIFLDKTFRDVEYKQASDRIYRIGQDTDVYIYTVILDTGNEPNLSTRMNDIVAWSKEQFGEIIGDVDDTETGIDNSKAVVKNIVDSSSTDHVGELIHIANKILNKLTNWR